MSFPIFLQLGSDVEVVPEDPKRMKTTSTSKLEKEKRPIIAIKIEK